MKKIQFSLLVLLSGFIFTVSAQKELSDAPKAQVSQIQSPLAAAAAKKITAEMNNLLTLEGSQQRMIFMTVMNHEEQYILVKESALSAEEKATKFSALEAKKLAEFQRILTPEQMAMYNTSLSAPKTVKE